LSLSRVEISRAFSRAKEFVSGHKGSIALFWIILVFADALNYFFQSQIGQRSAENSRVIEIFFQLFILFYSVVFIHFISNKFHRRRIGFLALTGESLMLSPGYLLQAILYVITVMISLCLLVLPGIYCGIRFYFAPLLSVLYPGYKGRTFMLSHELSRGQEFTALVIILITAIVPFIPDGIGLLLTGELKSIWSLWLAPFDGLLFLFGELLVVFYVLGLLEKSFPQDFTQPVEEKSA